MTMSFKDDWESAVQRLEAWWAGEVIDRVALQICAPRDGVQPRPIFAPPTLRERWTNIEYLIEVAEEHFRTTFYGGEAFPCFWPNLGPEIFTAYLGQEFIWGETTTWSIPVIHDYENLPPLVFNQENQWWQLTLNMIDTAVEVGEGRYMVGLTDMHGGGDALAALRNPEDLCRDLLDHPGQVKTMMEVLTPLWFTIYGGQYNLIQKRMRGSTTWLSAWSPGRYYPTSCDFICMISPEMFREFFLDDIIAQVEWLDHSLFHLDGPEAIKHLGALLEIPKLSGIQWVPGAGSSSMTAWIPLLKRIQVAGKNLHLSVAPDEIMPLLSALSPRGLMLATWCRTESEARALLKAVLKKI